MTPALAQSPVIDRHAATEINPESEQSNTATAPTMTTGTGDTQTSSLYSQISAQMIGQRFRRRNPLLGVERELAPARDMLEQAFLDFYPQLQTFCSSRQQPLNQTGEYTSKIAPVGKSA